MEDIEKHGNFTGFCNLGIQWQPIESEHMRGYFKMENKQTGILISKILRLSSCFGQLKRGDVLMSLDGVVIADDGTVKSFCCFNRSFYFSFFVCDNTVQKNVYLIFHVHQSGIDWKWF